MMQLLQIAAQLKQIKTAIDSLASVSPISAALVAQLLNDAGGYGAITAGNRIEFENGGHLEQYNDGDFSNLWVNPADAATDSRIMFFRAQYIGEPMIYIMAGDGTATSRISLFPRVTDSEILLNGSPVLAKRDLPLPGMWVLVASGWVGPNTSYGVVSGNYTESPLLMIVGDIAGEVPKLYAKTPFSYTAIERISPTEGPLRLAASGSTGLVALSNTGATAQNWKLYALII